MCVCVCLTVWMLEWFRGGMLASTLSLTRFLKPISSFLPPAILSVTTQRRHHKRHRHCIDTIPSNFIMQFEMTDFLFRIEIMPAKQMTIRAMLSLITSSSHMPENINTNYNVICCEWSRANSDSWYIQRQLQYLSHSCMIPTPAKKVPFFPRQTHIECNYWQCIVIYIYIQ